MDCMRLFTKEDVLDGDEKPVTDLFIPGIIIKLGMCWS